MGPTTSASGRAAANRARRHGRWRTNQAALGAKPSVAARVLTVVRASTFAHDPDDKMGGIALRLDKTKDKAYQFDYAFAEDQSTEEVYNAR